MISVPQDMLATKKMILSVGGSIVVPNEVNTEYLKNLRDFILGKVNEGWSFILVIGGGTQARRYIEAATEVMGKEITKDDQDWLGIHATRFNAHLVRTIFRSVAQPALITDPELDVIDDQYKVIVGSGWKPGWSTDYVATKIAARFGAKLVVNLTNLTQVYTADPKKDPNAQPLEKMRWDDFRRMVGDEWVPGMNVPYDPIAAKLCNEQDITVMVMNGEKIDNLEKCITGQEFVGTMLANEI